MTATTSRERADPIARWDGPKSRCRLSGINSIDLSHLLRSVVSSNRPGAERNLPILSDMYGFVAGESSAETVVASAL